MSQGYMINTTSSIFYVGEAAFNKDSVPNWFDED